MYAMCTFAYLYVCMYVCMCADMTCVRDGTCTSYRAMQCTRIRWMRWMRRMCDMWMLRCMYVCYVSVCMYVSCVCMHIHVYAHLPDFESVKEWPDLIQALTKVGATHAWTCAACSAQQSKRSCAQYAYTHATYTRTCTHFCRFSCFSCLSLAHTPLRKQALRRSTLPPPTSLHPTRKTTRTMSTSTATRWCTYQDTEYI